MITSGFRKIFVVAALAVAVAGSGAVGQARANVIFNFISTCNDPSTPCTDAFGGPGASVTGTLEVTDSSVVDMSNNFKFGANLVLTDIVSFTLFFNPIQPAMPPFFPTSRSFNLGTGASVTNFQTVASGLPAIQSIELTDADGQFFQYDGGETPSAAFFVLLDDLNNPTQVGAGLAPISFLKNSGLPLPEPGTLLTFLLGMAGIMALSRRRRVPVMLAS